MLLTVLTGAQFEEKLQWLLATVLRMQSLFKNRFKILRSKLELLSLCWDKSLQALSWKAGLLKNHAMQNLFARIEQVPAPVKAHVLKRFLYQNQKLQMLYFYTARKRHPRADVEQLDALLRSVQQVLKAQLE